MSNLTEENAENESDNKMFGPLTFEETNRLNPLEIDSEVSCLLCENVFSLVLGFDFFVKHLFEVHSLVIEDVQNIENLPEYINYWRDKFKSTPIEEIIPAIKVNSGSTSVYFVLSSLLREDKNLRHKLKLEYVLRVQEFERIDEDYTKDCLFCKVTFKGTRVDFVNHLISKHNLQLGNPQNLVYIESLVEKIDKVINSNLTCIYCNKIFPERNVLKEHMRKKLHKRLNRFDKNYDKYFIINYLEPNASSRQIQRENDDYIDSIHREPNNDEEYSDWNEKEDAIICLFCCRRDTNINTLCLHMEADHEFDFAELTKSLDFYQKIKFVNYVRKQTHSKRCFYCEKVCKSPELLQDHLFQEQHCKIPERKIFDQPEYYFPTYENDAFLYLIDDVED